MAIILFVFFKDIRVTNKIINKAIAYFAPLSFGVYLIHESPYIRKVLWETVNPIKYLSKSNGILIIYMLLVVVLIFICGCLVEYFRKFIVNCIGGRLINKLSTKIENYLLKFCGGDDSKSK